MGSPRLVAKNIHVQMTKENITDGPSYANVVGAFPAPRQSPIMGRRALGPPQAAPPVASPKLHRRQPSEVVKQEVCLILYLKFIFSKKATKIDKIFTVDLTLT